MSGIIKGNGHHLVTLNSSASWVRINAPTINPFIKLDNYPKYMELIFTMLFKLCGNALFEACLNLETKEKGTIKELGLEQFFNIRQRDTYRTMVELVE